jgi:hypothetical protein
LRTLIWKQWEKEEILFQEGFKKPVQERFMSAAETRKAIMEALAEDYKRDPGLYTCRQDLKERLKLKDADLDDNLKALEEEKLLALHKEGAKITLAKATYKGLAQAKPKEYYISIPSFVDKTREIF